VFEIRYFFSNHVAVDDRAGVSSTAIRANIRKLISQETPGKPLSDQQLVERLATDGVQVARRTVAKYRESLGIAPSSARRQGAG
jgi:RNA polymerase sigma-54 factor